VDGGELLQRSYAPEPQHCPLASSEGQVGIFGSVVQSASLLTVIAATEVLERCTIAPQPVGHDGLWSTVPLHRFPEKFQCCLAIARPRNVAFQHFAFVVYGAPTPHDTGLLGVAATGEKDSDGLDLAKGTVR